MAAQIRDLPAAYQVKAGIPNPFCNYPVLEPEIFAKINGQKVVDAGTPLFLNGDSRTFVTEFKNPRTRIITRQGEVVCINRTQPIKLRPSTPYSPYPLRYFLEYPPADIPVFKYEVTQRSAGPNKMPQFGRIHSTIEENGRVIGYYVDLINYKARGNAGNYGAAAKGERVPIAWTHIGKLEPNRPTNLSGQFGNLLGKELPPGVTSGWGRKTRRHTKKSRKTRRARRV
jgi:hypothetical protein